MSLWTVVALFCSGDAAGGHEKHSVTSRSVTKASIPFEEVESYPIDFHIKMCYLSEMKPLLVVSMV